MAEVISIKSRESRFLKYGVWSIVSKVNIKSSRVRAEKKLLNAVIRRLLGTFPRVVPEKL